MYKNVHLELVQEKYIRHVFESKLPKGSSNVSTKMTKVKKFD